MDTASVGKEPDEENREEEEEEEEEDEQVYKTKAVQFLGRSTPIILQNDNGPCPLLAICNVLLLRNIISLSLDTSEVSLKKLLSLVAERLIDSNSNVENKDEEYVHNQQQNIADAIDLLSHLATGIDVNVLFRKINDFEFTRECAIFDLLDIGLYHGWIVDPQDTDTASVIGSKSYNTLVGELVALETGNIVGQDKSLQDEDCVDFAAATTATFKVPSPCLSRGISFDESPVSVPCDQSGRRGDLEEEEELMRVLELSRDVVSMPVNGSLTEVRNLSTSTEVSTHFQTSGSGVQEESSIGPVGDGFEASHQSELHVSEVSSASNSLEDDIQYSGVMSMEKDNSLLKTASGESLGQMTSEGSGDILISRNSGEIMTTDMLVKQTLPFLSSTANDSAACSTYKDPMNVSRDDQSVSETCLRDNTTPEFPLRPAYNLGNDNPTVFSGQPISDLDSSGGRSKLIDVPESVNSSLEGGEPMYEGEECILDPGIPVYENREPIYEGEMILAKQAERREGDACEVHSKDEAAQQQNTASFSISSADGQLISNFLRNNASQLTIYGLFCLQEGLKERELCVFFRNNHFSTMFKYNGELYILATDQGYINQSDLVWEKLNEVNGDTVFMTGNFKEFKAGTQVNDPWDEQNAMTSTADYLAALEVSHQGMSTENQIRIGMPCWLATRTGFTSIPALSSDLQLAIALQQQEFEQQPQNQQPQNQQPQIQQPQNPQQSSGSSRSRLVTGPQVPRSRPHPPHRQESKSKDKCIVM